MKRIRLFLLAAFVGATTLAAQAPQQESTKQTAPLGYALRQTLSGHSGTVSGVAFSPDGHLLASGSTDKTVRLWDGQTGALVRTLTGHAKGVRALSYSPDGSLPPPTATTRS